MIKRIICYMIITLTVPLITKAQQINFNSWSNNYLQINSYNGNVSTDAYTLVFDGNGVINIPNWRLSVRLKQPVTSGAHTFPANKISLQPTITSGTADPGPVPTISQIGMPLNTILQEGQEVFLVPQSAAPLYNNPQSNNAYYNFQLKYNLTIEGGAYLAQFPSWINFYAQLEFKAYDQNNNLIGVREHVYQLQIGTLSGTPPVTHQFSLQVGSNAVNGLLELKTRADYIQGASITYTNGLTVNANTDYQIKVTSLQSAFLSSSGNSLPLNTIKLSLIPSSGNSGAVFPVWLSASSQKIASGVSTQATPVYYDINYASKSNDINLITAKMEQYTTTLQYEITPQ